MLLEIELMDPVNTAVIVQWLKDEDVTIRAVSKTEQYVNIINARVPVELLEMLAAQPGLYGIRSGYGIPPDTNDVLPRNQNGPPESAHSAPQLIVHSRPDAHARNQAEGVGAHQRAEQGKHHEGNLRVARRRVHPR